VTKIIYILFISDLRYFH